MQNQLPQNVILIKNGSGKTFHVRKLTPGTRYGKDMCLRHSGKAVIEFYDATFSHSVSPNDFSLGYFVSRYFAETISEISNDRGLLLEGSDRSMFASNANIVAVKQAFC